MTFELVRPSGCVQNCPTIILAEGEITRDTATAFLALWNHLTRGDAQVLISSSGGDLEGAQTLGRAFRRLGVSVKVGRLSPAAGFNARAADCDSACVYAYAGGARRSLAPGSSLGVHRFYMADGAGSARKPRETYTEADFARMQRALSGLAAYLSQMGIGAGLLTIAADTGPSAIRKLSLDEARSLNLLGGEMQAVLPAANPAPIAPLVAPSRAEEMAAPPIAAQPWPLVERNGRPWLVLTVPTASRRFGEIDNEVAIGCPKDSAAYVASFREILPAGRPAGQTRAALAAPIGGEFHAANDITGSLRGAISSEAVAAAERAGALALVVTSNATGGYPARITFPATGLSMAVGALSKACGLP